MCFNLLPSTKAEISLRDGVCTSSLPSSTRGESLYFCNQL
jgi:hypothetical protein